MPNVLFRRLRDALEVGPTTSVVGIVMGLVTSEQLLRFLEGRRILRLQAEQARRDVTVPAGP